MLLRNFYKVISQYMIVGDRNSNWTIKLPSGNTDKFAMANSSQSIWNSMGNIAGSENSSGIHLGSGTTSPTLDDYKLESRIGNGNFSSSVSKKMTINGNIIEATSTITITNTSSSQLTISEIGLEMFCAGGSSSYCYPLVERTVLDTPLVLEPNEVGQIIYKVTHTSQA